MSSAIESVRLNADDYLLKPYKPDDLLFSVARCLEKYDLKRKVKLYKNMLPVCCVCNKIRDDNGKEHGTGEWVNWQTYVQTKANVEVTHGYCPECSKKTIKEFQDIQLKKPS